MSPEQQETTQVRLARIEERQVAGAKTAEERIEAHEFHDQTRFDAVDERFNKLDKQMENILDKLEQLVNRTWQLAIAVAVLSSLGGGISAAAVDKAMSLISSGH